MLWLHKNIIWKISHSSIVVICAFLVLYAVHNTYNQCYDLACEHDIRGSFGLYYFITLFVLYIAAIICRRKLIARIVSGANLLSSFSFLCLVLWPKWELSAKYGNSNFVSFVTCIFIIAMIGSALNLKYGIHFENKEWKW